MKLKNKFTTKKFNEINERALVNEVAYMIGCTENVNDYISETLIQENEESGELDNYVLFYMFCEYIVKFAEKSNTDESVLEIIYSIVRNDYKELVESFKEEYFVEEHEEVADISFKINEVLDDTIEKLKKIKGEIYGK